VKELVALARARPGELTWAIASVIGGGRIGGEMFMEATKASMTVVPYGGGAPALTAVLGGHTSMLIGNMLDCSTHVASGKIRPIAVTSATRSSTLPDVPTVAESGYPGFEAINWFGAVVRSGTPRGMIDRLSAEIGRALKLPEVNDALSRVGMIPAPMSPAEFDAFLRREMETNGRIIKKLNLKIE
jgi:tripartite-type tricarboxylate transporter receptor subunit TctC